MILTDQDYLASIYTALIQLQELQGRDIPAPVVHVPPSIPPDLTPLADAVRALNTNGGLTASDVANAMASAMTQLPMPPDNTEVLSALAESLRLLDFRLKGGIGGRGGGGTLQVDNADKNPDGGLKVHLQNPQDIVTGGGGGGTTATTTWILYSGDVLNAENLLTKAAVVGQSHYITGFQGSFDAMVTGVSLLLESPTSTPIWGGYVQDSFPRDFAAPWKLAANTAVSLRLAAAGTGVNSRLTLRGYTA